jgi:hypothetical protein
MVVVVVHLVSTVSALAFNCPFSSSVASRNAMALAQSALTLIARSRSLGASNSSQPASANQRGCFGCHPKSQEDYLTPRFCFPSSSTTSSPHSPLCNNPKLYRRPIRHGVCNRLPSGGSLDLRRHSIQRSSQFPSSHPSCTEISGPEICVQLLRDPKKWRT